MPIALEVLALTLQPAQLSRATVEGLYIHVPFCFHKCHYCDFYSITRQTTERMEKYVKLTLREAEIWGEYGEIRPRTVFFGGGTPSLLPMRLMERLIGGLKERFELWGVHEWTIEANPATVTPEYCRMLREVGVDRLSFGAQSFEPVELKTLERHHDPQDVGRSVEIARQAGFTRLNVDLIYAIPGQDLSSWARSLERAMALKTPHVSCYGLTYESNTPIAVRRRLGLLQQVEESLELEMMRHARMRLAQVGIEAYEISNYAAAGEECRHNLVYWTGGNYIGLGPSAASHIEGWRWKNRPHLGEWEIAVERGELPAIELETLSRKQRAGELAMLLLRLARGLRYDEYAARTGLDARAVYRDQIDRITGAGLVETDERGFWLSERGLAVADAVAAEFLDVS